MLYRFRGQPGLECRASDGKFRDFHVDFGKMRGGHKSGKRR